MSAMFSLGIVRQNPSAFIRELTDVARAGDKWGINILYDNHQFHTSSWLIA